jgi:hypothetical protein
MATVLAVAIGLGFLAGWGAPAAAGGLTATYAFTWAGLEVGELEAEVAEDGAGYRVAWRGRTVGLIGTLFPYASEGASEGRRESGRLRPERFAGRSVWRDGSGAWGVAFDPDGQVARIDLPEEQRAEREPVPEALQVAPDPATLALRAIAAAGPGTRLEASSFDGKRAVRFALACADPATPAGGVAAELLCTVEGRLLAGASRRWRERQGDQADRREPVKVWLQPGLWPDELWPVRVEAPTRFGTVEARLVRAEPRPHMGR